MTLCKKNFGRTFAKIPNGALAVGHVPAAAAHRPPPQADDNIKAALAQKELGTAAYKARDFAKALEVRAGPSGVGGKRKAGRRA